MQVHYVGDWHGAICWLELEKLRKSSELRSQKLFQELKPNDDVEVKIAVNGVTVWADAHVVDATQPEVVIIRIGGATFSVSSAHIRRATAAPLTTMEASSLIDVEDEINDTFIGMSIGRFDTSPDDFSTAIDLKDLSHLTDVYSRFPSNFRLIQGSVHLLSNNIKAMMSNSTSPPAKQIAARLLNFGLTSSTSPTWSAVAPRLSCSSPF